MTNELKKMDERFETAKREGGLVDVKFYPGDRRESPRRRAAELVVKDKSKSNRVDITKDKL